jgi:hypothetical protein
MAGLGRRSGDVVGGDFTEGGVFLGLYCTFLGWAMHLPCVR